MLVESQPTIPIFIAKLRNWIIWRIVARNLWLWSKQFVVCIGTRYLLAVPLHMRWVWGGWEKAENIFVVTRVQTLDYDLIQWLLTRQTISALSGRKDSWIYFAWQKKLEKNRCREMAVTLRLENSHRDLNFALWHAVTPHSTTNISIGALVYHYLMIIEFDLVGILNSNGVIFNQLNTLPPIRGLSFRTQREHTFTS